jgi:hypothetical protein
VKRVVVCVVAALVFAWMVVTAPVHAQRRAISPKGKQDKSAQQEAKSRAKELAALETWLRRLIGRFTVPSGRNTWGPFAFESKTDGIADCIGIGSGPAVHCMMSVNASGEQRGIVWVYLCSPPRERKHESRRLPAEELLEVIRVQSST